ncbi:hypothetical protein Tco_0524395 [Tanacetum coccineum]
MAMAIRNLQKKLNDKIPKMVDEMFERVRAFIRGEMDAGSAEMVRPFQGDKGNTRPVWSGGQERARNINGPREVRRNMVVYTPYPRRDTFTPLTKTPKEILAMEGISFPEPPPLIGIPEKQNLNKFCDYHGDRGHNTNDCYQLKKIHVDSGSSSEIMYEQCFSNFNTNVRSRLKKCKASLVGFSGETYHPLGLIDLWVTMGEAGRNKTVFMEFEIVKCRSPYNVMMGRTGMRSLGAIVSTIHSMIKFPTDQGVVTMETSRETLWECMQLEKMLGSWEETQWRQHMEQMSRIREQALLQTRNNPGQRSGKELMLLEKREEKESIIGKIAIGSMLSVNYGTWQVQMDYSSLNKIYAKDMFPFPVEEEELAPLIGYRYKCFLWLPKDNSQIRMAEDDEEKTGFHTE